VYEELQRLEKLTEQIMRKLQLLEKENNALKDQLLGCQKEILGKEEAIEHFKNQIKISKIVRNIPVENKESAELRGRIDNYIKEIDKIITYLSE
jgi:chromosome segregation ATPase